MSIEADKAKVNREAKLIGHSSVMDYVPPNQYSTLSVLGRQRDELFIRNTKVTCDGDRTAFRGVVRSWSNPEVGLTGLTYPVKNSSSQLTHVKLTLKLMKSSF